MAAQRISEERKTAYYAGRILMVVGALLFFSTFVTFAMRFGDFSNFEANAKSSMFRAFGGMALMIVGGIVSAIGARGLAGSGVVLDPEQAREDLEPYSRMAGGMLGDVLEEADVDLGSRSEKVVVIRCRECDKLNPEDAKFCNECGKPL